MVTMTFSDLSERDKSQQRRRAWVNVICMRIPLVFLTALVVTSILLYLGVVPLWGKRFGMESHLIVWEASVTAAIVVSSIALRHYWQNIQQWGQPTLYRFW